VCTGFDLGESPDQIERGLQRNDARFNDRRARNATTWPILEGACD
jgi:hypothetical protein